MIEQNFTRTDSQGEKEMNGSLEEKLEEKLNDIMKNKYKCNNKTAEQIANMFDDYIRKTLNACDHKDYYTAKIIIPYI